ncbi:MAG TPA: universal stress protein [Chitinophagaceae bacterium]|nr:universal stress protein [Chitinophagaceae bacterium]
MNNILVPTDFSEVAKRAAIYALHFAAQVHASKIILYNAYQQPIATDASMTPVELIDFDEMRDISNKGMELFKTSIQSYAKGSINIEAITEYTTLAEGLKDICDAKKIDLVVMGVTGGGALSEVLIGSNAVTVAKHSTVPVVVVPPGTEFSDIKNVMLACDFRKVVETTPVKPIKQILDETKAKLFVLNIDHENKNFSPETPFESLMLDTLFYGYSPEYHFMDSTSFVEAINNFALDKNIDLIITIPKKHGFFEGLFKRSHTKQLAFHSHVPLMVIHD